MTDNETKKMEDAIKERSTIDLSSIRFLSKAIPYLTKRQFLDDIDISSLCLPSCNFKEITWSRISKVGKPIEEDPKSFMTAMQKILHSCAVDRTKFFFLVRGGKVLDCEIFIGLEGDNETSQVESLNKTVCSVWPGTQLSKQDNLQLETPEAWDYGLITGIPSMATHYDTIYPSTIDHLIEGMSNCDKYVYLVIAEPATNRMIDDILCRCREIQGQAESYKSANINISHADSEQKNEGLQYRSIDETSLAKLFSVEDKPLLKNVIGGVLACIPFIGNAVPTKNTGISTGTTDTTAISRNIVNKHIESVADHLAIHAQRFEEGQAMGMWEVYPYILTTNDDDFVVGKRYLKSLLSGKDSKYEPIRITNLRKQFEEWIGEDKDKENSKKINSLCFPKIEINCGERMGNPFGKPFDYLSTILTTQELTSLINFPLKSVPGVIVREQAEFGRNVILRNAPQKHETIELGNIMHFGEIEESNKVCLNADALTSHTFVTGTTGSGKSNTMYLLLQSILEKNNEDEEQNDGEKTQNEKIKFLVIEPTKGEYKRVFNKDVNVYGSNPKLTPLLKINPFEFVDEIHICEHVDRLVDIFNTCWPMYAAMPVVLKKSIIDAYRACGWDMEKSTWNDSKGFKLYPTVKDVVIALQKFINQSEYSADTKGDYKGSLETRLMALTEGLTGMMLNNPAENLSDEELFTKNVIVDLSRVGNSETKSLVMGLIIMKLTEYYQAHGQMNSQLRHVTVLEEAHNILKRTSTQQNQESSNLVGKSVEMLTNSIAEMRTYGEAFIIVDQSPSQVDMAAIRNTNTKIIMALPESEDRIAAGKSIGLKDEQIEEIARLKVGEAVVYQNDWEEPVLCKVKKYEGKEQAYKPCVISNSYDSKEKLYNTLELLYQYCKLEELDKENIDKVKKDLKYIDIPSTTKYEIYKILDGNTGDQVVNQTKVREIVSQCIGKQEKIAKIVAEAKDIYLNNKINELFGGIFPSKRDYIALFCIRSVLEQQSKKTKEAKALYDKWLNRFYLCK